MEKNITISKVGAFVSGSGLMSNMVIFQDPIYMYLAVFGGGVSMAGMIHEIVEEEHIKGFKKIFGEIIKALLFGVLLTPMVFMFYLKGGNKFVLPLLGVEGVGMLNSFWFLASVLTSWYIIPLWMWVLGLVKIRFRGWRDGK